MGVGTIIAGGVSPPTLQNHLFCPPHVPPCIVTRTTAGDQDQSLAPHKDLDLLHMQQPIHHPTQTPPHPNPHPLPLKHLMHLLMHPPNIKNASGSPVLQTLNAFFHLHKELCHKVNKCLSITNKELNLSCTTAGLKVDWRHKLTAGK